MKQIDIEFAAGNTKEKTFPVFYSVEHKESDCIQIFRCSIGLPHTQLPAWLRPEAFEFITHTRDGVQLVDYNTSHHDQPHTHEAELFRYKVYTEILFQELRRRKDKPAPCRC